MSAGEVGAGKHVSADFESPCSVGIEIVRQMGGEAAAAEVVAARERRRASRLSIVVDVIGAPRFPVPAVTRTDYFCEIWFGQWFHHPALFDY